MQLDHLSTYEHCVHVTAFREEEFEQLILTVFTNVISGVAHDRARPADRLTALSTTQATGHDL